MVTDWGAHHLDIAQWALGMDRSGPVAVESTGTLPPTAKEKNAFNVHTAFDITYTYPNNVTVLATSKGENGVRFEGENGWIFVSRDRIEASDPKLLESRSPAAPRGCTCRTTTWATSWNASAPAAPRSATPRPATAR
jgi:predicted dehydrogenase